MDRNEAGRKARKLLALAQGRGATPGESAAALAQAQAIMDRWQMTASDAELQPAGEAPEAVVDFSQIEGGHVADISPRASWRDGLAVRLSKLHGVYVWNSPLYVAGVRVKRLHAVGRPSDVEAFRYVFGWVSQEIAHLTERRGKGLGQVWRNEFARGACETVAQRLREQRQETAREVRAESGGDCVALARVERALVRVSEDYAAAYALAHKNTRLAPSRSRAYAGNGGAREAGREAGRGVSLGGSRGALGGAQRRLGGGL